MTLAHQRLATVLAIAGLIPFVLAAVLLGLDIARIAALDAGLAYGAVIASFLCGIHWGVFILKEGALKPNLLITSNAGALVAWAATVALPPMIAFLTLGFVFVVLLFIDRRLRSLGIIEDWYWALRRNVTAAVLVAMLALAGLSIGFP